MDATDDLRLLLVSRHPLVVARMQEEERFMGILRRVAAVAGCPVWTWSVTRGLARDGMGPQVSTADPRKALAFIGQLIDPGVFVFHDIGSQLGADPAVVRSIKEIAQAARPGQTIVLTGPSSEIPAELDGLALSWSLEPPSRLELRELVDRVTSDLASRGLAISMAPASLSELVDAVAGLSMPEAERLIVAQAIEGAALDARGVEAVRTAKAELLSTDGILELVGTDGEGLDRVGGLDELKAWLKERGRGFEPAAREFGLEPPRGVLLTGVPGCGKSLVAKTLARSWRMPLVLLDPGRIYGSYVGESEARLRTALTTIEAMAPVVLWIDEIEKGFPSDTGGDSGTSRRVLGSFLRWMQDRPPGVFLVATCNDVRAIAPELLRRGRFDDTFFVDLPGPDEREEIFRLHLTRRRRAAEVFDLTRLSAVTEGFSGAEIEGVVVGALYAAYADGSELTTDGLLAEAAETRPLSVTRAEDVAAIRRWAAGRAVPATNVEATAS